MSRSRDHPYTPLVRGELPRGAPDETTTDAHEEAQSVQRHRAVWQFSKMVVILGLVIGVIAVVTYLPGAIKGSVRGAARQATNTNGMIAEFAPRQAMPVASSPPPPPAPVATSPPPPPTLVATSPPPPTPVATSPPPPPTPVATSPPPPPTPVATSPPPPPTPVATSPPPPPTPVATAPPPTVAPSVAMKTWNGEMIVFTKTAVAAQNIIAKTNPTNLKEAMMKCLTEGRLLRPKYSFDTAAISIQVMDTRLRTTGNDWKTGGTCAIHFDLTAPASNGVFTLFQNATWDFRMNMVLKLNEALALKKPDEAVTGVYLGGSMAGGASAPVGNSQLDLSQINILGPR